MNEKLLVRLTKQNSYKIQIYQAEQNVNIYVYILSIALLQLLVYFLLYFLLLLLFSISLLTPDEDCRKRLCFIVPHCSSSVRSDP